MCRVPKDEKRGKKCLRCSHAKEKCEQGEAQAHSEIRQKKEEDIRLEMRRRKEEARLEMTQRWVEEQAHLRDAAEGKGGEGGSRPIRSALIALPDSG